MRLINCTTLEVEEFIGSKPPEYAILSHTCKKFTIRTVCKTRTDVISPHLQGVTTRSCSPTCLYTELQRQRKLDTGKSSSPAIKRCATDYNTHGWIHAASIRRQAQNYQRPSTPCSIGMRDLTGVMLFLRMCRRSILRAISQTVDGSLVAGLCKN